ncbi:MAG: hypothetical protein HYY23_03885 [Verrucomicrobia bacterium]|nr:hypothetical protein [Verrucomicrobiota bacterium]
MKAKLSLLPLAAALAAFAADQGFAALLAEEPHWVAPMKRVRARFTGERGTLAQFGDSITVSRAFWAPLAGSPRNMEDAAARAHSLVKE